MMRRVVALVIAGASVAGAQRRAPACATPNPSSPWVLVQRTTLSEEDGAWKNDSLRKVLLTAANMKGPNVPFQLGWEVQTTSDTTPNASVDYLKQLAATRGSTWPTRSLVGLAGVRAVFTLAHRDTALARAALKRMMESGPDEAIKPDVAVLEDRVRLMSGRKQLYGTQLVSVDGRLVPAIIEDSAHVDLRREGANLPPLSWSVCNANSK
jgi:hypothetical protein